MTRTTVAETTRTVLKTTASPSRQQDGSWLPRVSASGCECAPGHRRLGVADTRPNAEPITRRRGNSAHARLALDLQHFSGWSHHCCRTLDGLLTLRSRTCWFISA